MSHFALNLIKGWRGSVERGQFVAHPYEPPAGFAPQLIPKQSLDRLWGK